MSCSESFKKKMSNIINKTKSYAEFVFIDAPFLTKIPLINPGKCESYLPDNSDLDESRRSWWGWNSRCPNDVRYGIYGYNQDGLFYQKFNQTLEMLWEIWKLDKIGFDGIFGFSQGAVTASIFCDWVLRTKSNILELNSKLKMKFIILVSGFLKPVPLNFPEYFSNDKNLISQLHEAAQWLETYCTLPENFPLESYQQENILGLNKSNENNFIKTKKMISQIPSLHIFGNLDNIMPNERSISLM